MTRSGTSLPPRPLPSFRSNHARSRRDDDRPLFYAITLENLVKPVKRILALVTRPRRPSLTTIPANSRGRGSCPEPPSVVPLDPPPSGSFSAASLRGVGGGSPKDNLSVSLYSSDRKQIGLEPVDRFAFHPRSASRRFNGRDTASSLPSLCERRNV